jgi:polysaccharide biosynthesis protein PelA
MMRIVFLCLFLLSGVRVAVAETPSIAFYYGQHLPVAQLAQFQRVVVEADEVNSLELHRLQDQGARVYAYLSVGEADQGRAWLPKLPADWVLGRNVAWNSRIMDMSRAGWREVLLKRADALWAEGYRGLFLDTLDSYQAVAGSESRKAAQVKGLLTFLRALHARHPGMHVLLNRGFELLPQVASWVDGVAAESLYKGWDQAAHEYRDVSAKDRQWLLHKLDGVRKRFHLPVYVLDYVPPDRRAEAVADARRIEKLGFVPWVSNPALNAVGVGSIDPVPRHVLMLYDSGQAEDGLLANTSIHQLAALPLEYMGYVPTYWDVRRGLPDFPLNGRYAGIVTWFGGDIHVSGYAAWLKRQIKAGIPVAILGGFGFSPGAELLSQLGVTGYRTFSPPYRLQHADGMVGFEAKPLPPRDVPQLLEVSPEGGDQVHLAFSGSAGATGGAVVTGSWGGIALTPWVVEEDFANRQRWVIDPFSFLRSALHLKKIPVADVTTENGRRIWISEIDGDGFADISWMAGKPWAVNVIRKQVLQHYKLPVAASVIVGELSDKGIFPDKAPQLQRLARKIFRLPYIEIGSHTYSHPFDWEGMKRGMRGGTDGYNLPLKGYRFNLQQEVGGSASWIDAHLAPPGKRTRIIQWSGDALPPEKALALAAKAHLTNINGGNTIISKANPYLTYVSPMALPLGPYVQVYAPIMNEEVYTNNWKGPFWGFRNVIQTFEMTDRPRRLKPIDVYYHFYSGSKYASLNALKQVIDWTLKQPIIPIYASTYSQMVVDNYRRVAIARAPDGDWLIHGARYLRTLRLDPAMGWPDMQRSQGVIGFADLHDGRYISLDGRADVVLRLVDHPPHVPYLVQANAPLQSWRRSGTTLHFSFKGFQPVRLEIGGTGGVCRVAGAAGRVRASRGKTGWWYVFTGDATGKVQLTCP